MTSCGFYLVLAVAIGVAMTLSSTIMGPNYPVLKRISGGDGSAEAAYAIFGPVFFQCIIVFCFDRFTCGAWGLEQYYANSWVSVLLYRVTVIVFVAYRGRHERSFYWLFAVRTILSLGLSAYLSYSVLAQDISRLFPSTDDVVFQFWTLFVVVALGFLSTANDKGEIDCERLFYKIDNLAREKYPERFKQDHVLRALYCAFGMIEAYYRPKPVRALERLFFFLPCVKTTGIMQVKADRALTDEESIGLAFPMVEMIWDEFLSAKWAQAEEVADAFESDETPEYPFVLTGGGYSYRLRQMTDLVTGNFPSLHLRYMGTSKFEAGQAFFRAAVDCVIRQLYQPGDIIVKVESSSFEDLRRSIVSQSMSAGISTGEGD